MGCWGASLNLGRGWGGKPSSTHIRNIRNIKVFQLLRLCVGGRQRRTESMAESRTALRTEWMRGKGLGQNHVLPWLDRGRDVIAITSVGGRILEWSVTLPGSAHAPLRKAAMAMTALPEAEPRHSSQFPVSLWRRVSSQPPIPSSAVSLLRHYRRRNDTFVI